MKNLLMLSALGIIGYSLWKKSSKREEFAVIPSNTDLIDYAHASPYSADAIQKIENVTTEAGDYYMNDPYGKKSSKGDYFSELPFAGMC